MHYFIDQLPDKRWGIYCNLVLLASVGCRKTSLEILTKLQNKKLSTRSQKVSTTKA